MAIFHSCVSLPDILGTDIESMLGAVGWFIDSNRISHDQLETNCPPEAQIAVGPKNMNDQLALHNIPRYTYYHLSNNVQTMFRLLMLRIIYIPCMYRPYLFFSCRPYANQAGGWTCQTKTMGFRDVNGIYPQRCHVISLGFNRDNDD